MARPKKLGTDEMLKIVNDYYESCGNAKLLKCSLLEEYAVSQGFDVKAYDFRRNADVRFRISELRDLEAFSDASGIISYKSLDADALINNAKSKESLKNSLLELDEAWRRTYDRATILSIKNSDLTERLQQKTLDCEKSTREVNMLSEQLKSHKKDYDGIALENRYLRKMLKTYLYPAIANEILKTEHVLERSDAEIPQKTVDIFADDDIPASFSQSTDNDRQILSREDALLQRLRKSVHEVNGGE
jgi:hypothetical protein